MHNLVLSPIDPEKLISDISERVTANILKAVSNEQLAHEQYEQWFDLDELIKYDPEKRKKPTWYSKISKGEVPYHKRGKKVYFLKSEFDQWLRAGKRKSNAEIDKEAEAYLFNRKKKAE